jgi:hypothetical protein
MTVVTPLRQEPGDIANNRKAWSWQRDDLLRYARAFADCIKPEQKASKPCQLALLDLPPIKASDPEPQRNEAKEAQNAVTADAEKAGYPKSLIRKLGYLVRRIGSANGNKEAMLKAELEAELRSYAHSIGLGSAV